MKKILVTGAAGYLGGTTSLYLLNRGYQVIGIDDFSTSHPNSSLPFEIIQQDLRDFSSSLEEVKKRAPFDGIIHFAARALVPESFKKTMEYFDVNINSTLSLLEIAQRLHIPAFVHSSTCAVYGIPSLMPIPESHPLAPISPYGESKKCAEALVERYTATKAFKALALRYFNPAGALKESRFGECHDPETHLIPKLIQTASRGHAFEVFGKDYDTPDGTCIRDYIHVEDLSRAHVEALVYLWRPESPQFQALNVGTGKGTSVLEVVNSVQKVTGKVLELKWGPRRTGDPATLIAGVKAFKDLFGWVPSKSLDEMIYDQWAYSKSAPG